MNGPIDYRKVREGFSFSSAFLYGRVIILPYSIPLRRPPHACPQKWSGVRTMRRNLCLAASAVLLVAAGAWTSGGAPVQAQSAPAGRKLAFLVGVNKYAHAKLDDLQFAEADVEDLAEV